MSVGAMTVSLVVEPHSFIYVTISMDKGAHTISLVVLPHALVPRRVWPDLHTAAMFLSMLALASVSTSVGVLSRTLVEFVIWLHVSTSLAILLSFVAGVHAPFVILNFELLSLLVNVNLVVIA